MERNGTPWALTGILASVVLGATVAVGPRLWPYWVARERGGGADLRGAVLVLAPLRGADLHLANLAGANLAGSDLVGAKLWGADMTGADLCGASLRGADLSMACLASADVRGADLRNAALADPFCSFSNAKLGGARYDSATRWPAGIDPGRLGALKVPDGRAGVITTTRQGVSSRSLGATVNNRGLLRAFGGAQLRAR